MIGQRARGARLLAGALVAASLLGWSALAGTAANATPAPSPTASQDPPKPATAVDDYGSCLAADKKGDLLLLFDQSSSLQASDPNAARVTAATYLLDRLRTFSNTAGVDLSVGVAGFDAGFEQTTPWTSLNDRAALALRQGVESYRDRDTGFETDYWSALDGARQALAGRVSGGNRRCQAIAWFSDGKLDISPRGSDADKDQYGSTKPFDDGVPITDQAAADQVKDAARTSLCRPAGLADQLRTAGIVVFGIGLTNGGAAPSDFDLMSSASSGQPVGGQTCGAITTPPPGQFQLASNLDGLLFAFDQLSTPGQPPLQTQEPVCQRTLCQNQHQFVLDRSIQRVGILGQAADVASLDASILTPSGATIDLGVKAPGQPTTVMQDGVSIDYTWQTDKTVAITLTNPQGVPGWTGAWALVFLDKTGSSPAAVSKANIHITGDLKPAWRNQPSTVRSGEPLTGVDLGIVDGRGSPVDPAALLGSANLTATIYPSDGSQAQLVALDKTTLDRPQTIDLSSAPTGGAQLRLSLAVTTADTKGTDGKPIAGTVLEPTTVDIPLDIAAPLGFPVVANKVDFGSSDASSVTADLSITGPGCVWLDPATPQQITASPDGVGKVGVSAEDASSPQQCVTVGDRAQGQLPLTLSVAQPGNGGVGGTLSVSMSSAQDPNRIITVPVDFTASLRKPLDAANFVLGLIAALILGPGIPLLLLYGTKFATSRIPARPLTVALLPVEVRDGQVLRDGAPFALRETDLRDLVPIAPRGSREITTAGLRLSTHIGLSPVGAGTVALEAPARIGASSADPSWRGKKLTASLPLAVHNTWVVLVDPTAPEDQATLVLLVGGETSQEQREALVEDMARRLPSTLDRLRLAAASAGLLAPSRGLVGAGASPFGDLGQEPAGPSPFGDLGDPAGDPFSSPSGSAPQAAPDYGQGPPPGYQQGPRPHGPPPQGPPPGYRQGPPPQGPPPGNRQGPPPGPGGGYPLGPPPPASGSPWPDDRTQR